MYINTDRVPALNETKNIRFNCTIVNHQQYKRLDTETGQQFIKTSLVISVGRYCDVDINDKIMILNESHKVINIEKEYNQRLLSFRCDYDNLITKVVIHLE